MGDVVEPDGPRRREPPRVVHLLRAFAFAYADRTSAIAADIGLHPTDLRALVELLDAERQGRQLTAGGLAQALGMTTPATAALLKRLERRGLLARRRSQLDGRRVELVASPAALELGWHHFGELVDLLAEIAGHFEPRTTLAMEEFLGDALDVLRGDRGGGTAG
ncbi:helix-turn-helix domain-containing protein [Nocardioides sp. CER19]|uniref:MarR family winged helix-turn-helix transcriptional regulator n=1 Tax=Nocardioides sp. CER19 TaxID=3038538 RepID=UPI00244C32C9|nr:helix-turn-helix domain-containing protein [Nocardioides sp. CER19]MDH2416200.1 helix-turn-helix domain-containing protein [Nocardioides sp. CER19]